MGEVVHVNFGCEREWEATRAKVTEALLLIGATVGDDEALLRAKADCIYRVMRAIVEDIPSAQITTRMPEGLSNGQVAAITDALRLAALQGIEVAMSHSVTTLMSAIGELCTSKLRQTT